MLLYFGTYNLTLANFFLSFFIFQLTRIFQTVQGKTYYPLLVLMAIFFPLQGFFNAIIYLRPRYLKHKSANPNRSFFAICWSVLKTKDNLGRDNTQYSVSEREDRRRSFVSIISSAISNGRKSFGDKGSDDDPSGDNRGTGGTDGSAAFPIQPDLVNGNSSDDNDDDSFNSEDDLRRIEEAIAQRGENVQKSSVTFTESTKNFDGRTSPAK